VFFSSSKYTKTRLRRWGSLRRSPRPSSRLGRGHLVPFPQLLQPQLLNNCLSGLTLFFIDMKQRLLTMSVTTRYRVIFAFLYWKSRRKVREFHVVWTLESGHCVSVVSLCDVAVRAVTQVVQVRAKKNDFHRTCNYNVACFLVAHFRQKLNYQ